MNSTFNRSAILAATSLTLALALGTQAFADPTSVNLNDFKGSPFFEAMTAPNNGIQSSIDQDYNRRFSVLTKAKMKAAERNFNPEVVSKVKRMFKDSDTGLDQIVDLLQGVTMTPESSALAVGQVLSRSGLQKNPSSFGLNRLTLSTYLGVASNAGTTVTLDEKNYYVNMGYKPASEDHETQETNVKSGRSYGASPLHKLDDASDTQYLTELDHYLSTTRDVKAFYTVIMDILVDSDTSGLAALSDEGQGVVTDLIAIYTAELDRHLMTNLVSHPWENDLAEVTFLSAYGTKSKKVMKDGAIVDGKPTDYYAKNPVSGRSGIGLTRNDRRKLQSMVSKAEKASNPALVQKLERLVKARPGTDVMRAMMEYLNNRGTQAAIKSNSKEIRDAFVEFLMQSRADASAITTSIQ